MKKFTALVPLLVASALTAPLGALEIPEVEEITILVASTSHSDDFDRIVSVTGEAELVGDYTLLMDAIAVRIPGYALNAAGTVVDYTLAQSYAPLTLPATNSPAGILSGINENETTSDYLGEGMCIAILDTGFLTEHESFIIKSLPKLTQDAVDAITPELNIRPDIQPDDEAEPESSYYISEKIPFAYNYADQTADVSGLAAHGTQMLSAAAGNDSGKAGVSPGAAPEAQVLAMKVYSDWTGTADEASIISAMEDAVRLGADVICLSLGEACGFDSAAASGLSLETAMAAAVSLGIPVIASAGNNGDSDRANVYATEYGIAAATTDHPDSGSISYPGSSSFAFTAGSAVGNRLDADAFTLPDGTLIPFGDSNYLYAKPTGGASFAAYFGKASFGYQIIPGLGKREDFDGLDLTGQLAVIERGTLTFVEKASHAAEAGAVGVIIIDNQDDIALTHSVRMELSGSPIPVIIVSQADGELLRQADRKTLTLSGEKYHTELSETPVPSAYSSAGVTPGLALKPDVTVEGELISCVDADGFYTPVSGTSVSAARLAGIYVRVKQKLLDENPDTDPFLLMQRIQNILASSAEIMVQENGYPYSPRSQGAGVVSADDALGAELLITSEGSYKVELGELNRRWLIFTITAENLSDSEQNCSLEAVIGSDGYTSSTYAMLENGESETPLYERLGKQADDTINFIDEFAPFCDARTFFGDADMEYSINAFSDHDKPYEFTLDAHASRNFKLGILIDDETFERYQRVFNKGFFVEGFITLTTEKESASLPFVGFSGKWSAAEATDADRTSGVEPIYDGIYLYRYYNDSITIGNSILGYPPFALANGKAIAPLSFSPVADADDAMVYMNLGLLRSIIDVTMTVSDSTGQIVYTAAYGNVSRTYRNNDTGQLTSAQLPVWNGRAADNPAYIYPDGVYTATLSYRVGNSTAKKSFSYTLSLDTQKPVLASYTFSQTESSLLLKLETTDNIGVAEVSVTDIHTNDALMNGEGDYDITVMNGKYLYVTITDYALNIQVYRLDNPFYSSGI